MVTKWNAFTSNFDLTASTDTLVVGPGISTDNAICRFDGTTGKVIQSSGSTISDGNTLSTGEINLTTALAASYGGTGTLSYASGDILYASGATALSKLGIGTAGHVLTVVAGVPAWAAAAEASPLTTKGDLYGYSTTNARIPVGANDYVLTADSTQALGVKWAAAAGGGLPDAVFGGTAAAHEVNTTTAFAPINYRDFGSVEILTRAFDQTGPEYMQGSFIVPADLGAGASNVTFKIVGSAATASASKNVKFTFDFVQVAAGGAMTGAYGGAEIWDDQSISGTQDYQDIISNPQTITTLGWVAGRVVYYRLYRSAATTNNLAVDYDVISFTINVPRA